MRVVYSREPAGWCEEVVRIDREARPYDPQIAGTLVCGSDRQPLPGRVLIHDLPGDHPYLRWNQEKLSETWARYFPDVPAKEKETFSFPRPGSDEFWKMYAEPLGEFLWGADALATALKNLQAARQKRRRMEFSEASEHLNSLLAPVSPKVSGPDPFRLEWQSPSLLGSFAMMALLELVAESARICSCTACGTVFVSKAYQSVYCSDTCRHTVQKRRQRARRKMEATVE